MTRIALYPGSFDPPTKGHEDLVRRSLALADQVIVAIARNATKQPLFSVEERLSLLREAVGGDTRISIQSFDGLLAEFAKRVGAVGEHTVPRELSHSIESMAQLVLEQVHAVVDEYSVGNAEALSKLRADDERIDVKYTSVFRELLTYMMEDPRNITACTHLLFCAKNLERIGDHVTNIAENAYYVLTGEQLPPNRPKLDETAAPAA